MLTYDISKRISGQSENPYFYKIHTWLQTFYQQNALLTTPISQILIHKSPVIPSLRHHSYLIISLTLISKFGIVTSPHITYLSFKFNICKYNTLSRYLLPRLWRLPDNIVTQCAVLNALLGSAMVNHNNVIYVHIRPFKICRNCLFIHSLTTLFYPFTRMGD